MKRFQRIFVNQEAIEVSKEGRQRFLIMILALIVEDYVVDIVIDHDDV